MAAGLVVSRPLPSVWREGFPLAASPPLGHGLLERVPGDALQLYYHLWLVRDALTGGTPFSYDPYQFRIDGPRRSLAETFPPLAVPFALLSPLGPVAAFNLLVFLSFPLAGLAAYGLVRHLTGVGAAAAVAGAAFALAPARLEPLFAGQPAGWAAALAPVAVWGLDVAFVRGAPGGGLAGGSALLALAMLEPHYALLTGVLCLGWLMVHARGLGRRARAPRALAAFGSLAVAGAAWSLLLYRELVPGSIVEAGRSLAEVRAHSPGPAALLPEAWGGVAVLAAVGAVMGPARRGQRAFWAATAVVGLILSLGPTVPHLPLYEILHQWVPVVGFIRNVDRFRLLPSLGTAVLAGLGAAAVVQRVPERWARGLGFLLVAGVVVAMAPWHPIAVSRYPETPLYALLRRDAERVVYVPVIPGDSPGSAGYLYHATRTRVPMLNGYSPFLPRRLEAEVLASLRGLDVGEVGPEIHALLRRLRVSHVVLDTSQGLPGPLPLAFVRARLAASGALAPVWAEPPFWLFRVTDRPSVVGGSSSPVGLYRAAAAFGIRAGSEAEGEGTRDERVVARAGRDPTGTLLAGPLARLPAGDYRLAVRARGAGLAVEIAQSGGGPSPLRHALAAAAVWTETEVPLTLEQAAVVEVRITWDGRSDAGVEWVALAFADRPEPEWTFEVEALEHRLVERADPQASGGSAGYLAPGAERDTDVLAGPSRRYPAGDYRVLLRARAETPASGALLRLWVSEAGGRVLADRTIGAAELPAAGYGEVALPFRLARTAVLDFPVTGLGGAGIYLDRLRVSPVSP